jgi:hypothetical protein
MSKTPAQRLAKHGSRAVLPASTARTPNVSTRRDPAKAAGNANLILIAALTASLFLFWYFHLLTLQQMTQLSNGMAMPDSLPWGFGPDYIERLRSAMDTDAVGQLQYVHKTAGTLFPLVFGFTAMLLIAVNVATKRLRWLLWIPPILFAILQLCANVSVDGMLSAGSLSDGAVVLSSVLVVASWALLLLSLLAIAAALFMSRRRRKRPAAVASP